MTSCNLNHLRPAIVIYETPLIHGTAVERYVVEVSYSDHCYTILNPTTGKREFSQLRYDLSKMLPEIIKTLMERRCSFTERGNFFTVDLGKQGEYEIYFTVYKHKGTGTIKLLVQSAYIRDPETYSSTRPKWFTIKFRTILYNVLHNKPMHR